MKRSLRFAVLVPVLAAGLCTPCLAAQGAYSVPISDQVIVLELTLPSGEVTKAAVREGAMFKVRDTDVGFYYGFTPVLGERGAVLFTVFSITEVPSGEEMLRQVGKEEVNIAAKRASVTPEGFGLRVVRVFEAPPQEDEGATNPTQPRS